MDIQRFDTLFVRGRGFRYRSFGESGELVAAVWSYKQTTRVWFNGQANTRSIDDALIELKGISTLSSWLIPTMLFGGRPSASPAQFGGIESATCGKCIRILFEQPGADSQLVLSVDADHQLVRRMQYVVLPKDVGESRLDVITIYESQIDIDADAASVELEKQPW